MTDDTKCEGGCDAPVVGHDSEGVPLCRACLESLESERGCCYCGGDGHDADNCPTTFTPINDCEHKDADDGCCHHPKNMTPECHVGACPRLHRRIYDAWSATLSNTSDSATARSDVAL